jgi:tetratricopeptide (TPR) repeat protein
MSVDERALPASRRLVGFAALLVLAVAALYAQTARHAFVSYDDGSYLTENPHVAGGLTAANVRWAFTAFHSSNWHPLTWLSHQLDVTLFGLAPGPHHLVNAGLHALNAVLLLFFLARTTASLPASFLVALLFAVHPQRVESVAWASERKDVLAGVFFFATLLAYARYARAPSRGRYGLVALFLALGLLAKPMLVSVPLVLLALDLWPLGRGLGRRTLLEKLPLVLLAASSAAVTLVAQELGGAVQGVEVLSLPARLATAVLGTLAYIGKMFWPSGLAFFYPHPAFVAPAEFAPFGWRVGLGALVLVALTLAFWRLRARFPFLLAGWLWMAVMLAPVIGLVQVGAQFYADRYAYLPMVGPTFALVFLGRELLPGATPRRLAFGLGLVAALAYALVAYRQVGTWKDSRTLCERALAVTQHNYVAHEHLGLDLQRNGDLDGAEAQYRAALAIAPDPPSTHGNLGALYAQRGKKKEAAAEFQAALRLVPDFLPARLSWGYALELEGDFDGAREHYALAARQHPEASEAWQHLGEVELARLRPEDALAAYTHARALTGDSAELALALGAAQFELGRTREALAEFATADALSPGNARARHGRVLVYAASQDPALRDPERALTLLESCPAREVAGFDHQRALAATLAARGHFEQAASAAAHALADAPRAQWERLKAELALYKAGRALER